MNELSDTYKGAFFAFIGFSGFAWGDAVFKYLGDTYSIFMIGFCAAFFSLVFILLKALYRPGIKACFKTQHLFLHLLRGTLLLAQFLLVLFAFKSLSLAKFYALIFAAPFLAIIFAYIFLREKISLNNALAVFAGMIGILVILRPGVIPVDTASLATLAAAAFFAASNIITRFIGHKDHPYSFVVYTELVIIPVTGVLMIQNFIMPSLFDFMLMVLTGGFSAIGLVFIAKGFAHAPAAIAAPFHYVQMLWGILFGYLIFGDVLDWWIAAGSAIIIGSGFWLLRKEKPAPQEIEKTL